MAFINYLRSSSIGTLGICEHQYALIYNLGLKSRSGKSAQKGTIFHRAMQCLGDKKLALKEGKKTVDFEGKKLTLKKCDDIPYITQLAFDYYTSIDDVNTFTKGDLADCIKWVELALDYNNGALDPRNQDIYTTEKYFDFEIPNDWARYEFTVKGEKVVGQCRIRGTVDLILNEGEKYLHVLDYKTGKRMNWATFKEKTYEDLEYDSQLLLYYYALKNLYPDHEFIVSIYYVNSGGLFSFPYEQKHFDRAESMLRQKFEYIKSIEVPRLVSPDNSAKACQYLCGFSKPMEGTNKSICQFYHSEIKEKGLTAVVDQYADFNALGKYTGGGRIDQ